MLSKSPKVCCVVLTWNDRANVLACLKSLSQVVYPNLEIVVSDNGSTDGTIQAIREQYPQFHLLENGENLYWAGGNNVGLTYALAAQADYVILLNNDTVVAPEMIPKLVQAGEADRSIGLLAPKIYYHDRPELVWYAGARVSMWRGLLWHVGIRQPDRGQFDRQAEVDYVTGCALMVRRQVLEQIGLIDTAFVAYGEDVDFSFRARRAGWRLVMVPSAIMWHKVSAYWGVVSVRKTRQKLRSNLILYRRYAPVWSWFSTIPLFLLLDSLRVLLLLVAGRLRVRRGGA